jgi:hypothetical protein
MTQQQFIEEVKRLSVTERIALLEIISRSVREELEAGGETPGGAACDEARSRRERRAAAVRRLRGLLKVEGAAPSDAELKEDYVTYLSEKYS